MPGEGCFVTVRPKKTKLFEMPNLSDVFVRKHTTTVPSS